MYIPTWLLFYSRIFGSALVPFSNILFYYKRVLLLSNVIRYNMYKKAATLVQCQSGRFAV